MLSRKDLVTVLADTIATDFFVDMLNPSAELPRTELSVQPLRHRKVGT